MKLPTTIRMSAKELRLLRKVTKVKTTAEAIRKLLHDEVERQNQVAFGEKIHGTLKPTDFDDRLL